MKYLYKLSTQISIFLFLIIVFSFFWWQTNFSTKKIAIDLNDNKNNASLNIEEAKYSDFSENGKKFSFSAKLITENQSKENVLNLKNPNAIIETKKNEITISANNGEFHVKDKSIFLLDNVSFFDENYDFNLKSTELNGNLEKREFYSKKPIDFKMSSGFIKSENFHYDENKQKVLFLGRTELVFFK